MGQVREIKMKIMGKEISYKQIIWFFVGLVIIAGLFAWTFIYWYHGLNRGVFEAYDYRWWECIDALKEGSLYNGGLAECAQGPVIFFAGYVHSLFFGPPQQLLFHYSIEGAIIILCFLTLYLINRVIQKEGFQKTWFFSSLLFVLLILYFAIYKYEVVITMFSFFLAFYLLYYTELKYKEPIASLLMAISFLTKSTTIFPIIFLYAHYMFKSGRFKWENNKFHLNKKNIKTSVWLFLPATILILIIWVIYPNVFIYAIVLPTSSPNNPGMLVGLSHILFHFSPRWYLLHIMVAVFFYMWYKTRKLPYLISSAAIFFMAWSLTLGGFSISNYMSSNPYTLPVYPFTIISLFMLYRHASSFGKHSLQRMLFFAFVILLLVYPSYINGPIFQKIDSRFFVNNKFEQDKSKLRLLVEGSLGLIPAQDGQVLFEWATEKEQRAYLLQNHFQTPMSQVDGIYDDFIGAGNMYDPTVVIPMKRILGQQYVDWENKYGKAREERFKKALQKYIDRVEDGNYTLIVEGPPKWSATIEILDNSKEYIAGYCNIAIPDLTYFDTQGMHYRILYMKNVSNCQDLLNKMLVYYSKTYSEICSMDEWVANNVVGGALKMDGVPAPPCSSGSNLIFHPERHMLEDRNKNLIHLAIIFGAFLLAFLLSLFFIRKNKSQ